MTSKPLKHRRNETTTSATRISNVNGTYHIGAEIGRGGFAVVFQALNVETGDFVAVKRFPLSTVDEESLASIQGEVELMKKLHHENIVQYIDTIRTDEFLYIALEFMENGSLASVLKKFGAFTESLTAIYVTQVLRGLKYLHEQGVLHRDIKGANILTTKDGLVKLADFGVAMKLDSKADEQDVVGTPYWMAPEIIEMSTPTAACDIWSVGCTIVELLTGKPPYYDLAPMAALFRIVQDDHPPLPEGISEALRDFLLQCFQKEPIMRKSAEELLRHPWLQKTAKQGAKDQARSSALAPAASLSSQASTVEIDLSGFEDSDEDKDVTIKASAASKLAAARSGPPRPTKSAARLVGGNTSRPQPHRRTAATKATTKIPKVSTVREDSDDDWDADFAPEPVRTQEPTTKPRKKHLSRPSMDDISAFLDSNDLAQATTPVPVAKPAAARPTGSILSRFKENVEDDFEDFDLETASLQDEFQDADNLRQRMQLNATNPDDLEEELFMEFDENDFAQNESKDVHIRRAKEILSLMSSVTVGAEDEAITLACKTLLDMLDSYPEQKEHLVTHHGVLPIIEMLEVTSRAVLPPILRVVNKVIVNNKRAQEQLSLVGAIPIMIHLIESTEAVDDVCLEAAKFVQQLCLSSGLTLQMLIGAGGLPALVKLMSLASKVDNDSARELARIATDCILQVFHVQSSRTRDYCRLFAKFGLLTPLGATFRPMFAISQRSDSPDDWNETHRIAMIISHFSRADAVVIGSLAAQGIIPVVIEALKDPKLSSNPPPHQRPPRHARVMSQSWFQMVPFPPAYVELMETLLKCVKNISMEPSVLDHLAAAEAISTLIPIMNGPIGDRAKIHIMPCMFNLCRISKRRQEQAAEAGLIPHLQRLVNEDSHLKQFALPIICDIAHASQRARNILWEQHGVKFYLNLLQENYWQINALNSLSTWLAHDTIRVEGLMIQPANLTQLVEFFRGASESTLLRIHKPFFDIMAKSSKLSKALGGSGLFVESLVSRLRSSDAVVLRTLLKMLRRLHECHPNPRQLVLDFNLYQIVQGFEQLREQVLVQQYASKLLSEFQRTTLA